jgi:hypothetical protein
VRLSAKHEERYSYKDVRISIRFIRIRVTAGRHGWFHKSEIASQTPGIIVLNLSRRKQILIEFQIIVNF